LSAGLRLDINRGYAARKRNLSETANPRPLKDPVNREKMLDACSDALPP